MFGCLTTRHFSLFMYIFHTRLKFLIADFSWFSSRVMSLRARFSPCINSSMETAYLENERILLGPRVSCTNGCCLTNRCCTVNWPVSTTFCASMANGADKEYVTDCKHRFLHDGFVNVFPLTLLCCRHSLISDSYLECDTSHQVLFRHLSEQFKLIVLSNCRHFVSCRERGRCMT